MTPPMDEPQTRMTDIFTADESDIAGWRAEAEANRADPTALIAELRNRSSRMYSAEYHPFSPMSQAADFIERHRSVEPPREMVERARAVIAPYFATDGEEEDLRIAEAVEGLLGDMAAEFTSVRSQTIEECARVAFEWLGGDKSEVLAPGCAAAIRAMVTS